MILKAVRSWAHACNPSYLGGWDQEDHGSRPACMRPWVWSPVLQKKSKIKQKRKAGKYFELNESKMKTEQSKYVGWCQSSA
jgi:hypothetical protein